MHEEQVLLVRRRRIGSAALQARGRPHPFASSQIVWIH